MEMGGDMNYNYDLSHCPASFDFLVWLSACSKHSNGKPFNVGIYGFPKQLQQDVYGMDLIQQMFWKVCMPSMALFPVAQFKIGKYDDGHYIWYTAHVFQQMGHPKSLIVPKWAKDAVSHYPENTVVINLRDCPYHPQRNSNIAEWMKAAHKIRMMGYYVVICNDPYSKVKHGRQYNQFDSECIITKAALFERAYAVLGVNNGAMALAWHNENVRYVTYKPLSETTHCRLKDYLDRGFVEGGSWPWAKEYQIYQWADDDCENILDGFKRLQSIVG